MVNPTAEVRMSDAGNEINSCESPSPPRTKNQIVVFLCVVVLVASGTYLLVSLQATKPHVQSVSNQPPITPDVVKQIHDVGFTYGVAASANGLDEYNSIKDFPTEQMEKEMKTRGAREPGSYRMGWIEGYNFGLYTQQGSRIGKLAGRRHAERRGGVPTAEALENLARRECRYDKADYRAYWINGYISGFAEEYKAATRPAF